MSYLLYFLILLEGIASIAIEVLTLRQLSPVVGTSIIVTSSVIGVFLLFLSIGYYYGGQCKTPSIKTIIKNFLIAGGWVGLTLSSLFIDFLGPNLLGFSYSWILLYTAGAIGYPIFLLGKTVPITTNLIKANMPGEASGKALFISTIGSVVGSVGLSLIVFRYLGVAQAIFIVCISLMLPWLLIEHKKPFAKLVDTIILIPIFLIIYSINIQINSLMFFKQNAYADYFTAVTNKKTNEKIFYVNNQSASRIDNNLLVFEYITHINNFLKNREIKNSNILVLGAGGFTISKVNTDNKFTYVDIDPDIKNVVEQSGFNNPINGGFISEDARVYIKKPNIKHDVVIIDVYSNRLDIPQYFTSVEFFKNIDSILNKNGYAIYNFILDRDLKLPLSQKIINGINAAHGACLVENVKYIKPPISSVINTVVMCAKKDKHLNYYTENNNEMPFDSVELYSEVQRTIKK